MEPERLKNKSKILKNCILELKEIENINLIDKHLDDEKLIY
jgi:hypothetical protein